jgi:tetratricopeptide (TPR) repeat protein
LLLATAEDRSGKTADALQHLNLAFTGFKHFISIGVNPAELTVALQFVDSKADALAKQLTAEQRYRDAAIVWERLRNFARDAYRIYLEEGEAVEAVETGTNKDQSVWSGNEQVPGAIENYIQAWKTAPTDRPSMAELVAHDYEDAGQEYLTAKHYEEALSNFEKAEPYVPADDDVGLARLRLLKARTLVALGRQGEWRAECEIALSETLTSAEWTAVEAAPVGSRSLICR